MWYSLLMTNPEVPPAEFLAPLSEILTMEVEEVNATGTGAVVRTRRKSPRVVAKWTDLRKNEVIQIQRNGSKPFYFRLDEVKPTAEGSAFAWLVGHKVNASGKSIPQVDHLHLPEGRRQELVKMDAVSVR